MALLVTGATGFIGSYVVKAALAQGHKVTIPIRSPEKAAQFLPLDHPNLTCLCVQDLSDIPAQAGDKLIHLAWGEVGKYTDPNNLLGNLTLQFEFLRLMIEGGMQDITVGGTCLEYGLIEGKLNEEMACYPVTYYGLAKLTLFRMLEIYRAQSAFSLKWLRYFYVHGEGQRPQSLFGQLSAAIERGDSVFPMSPADQQRDFITAETLAHNTLAAALQDDVTGIINIGNGKPLTVRAMAECMMAARQSNLELKLGHYSYPVYEPFAFWADTEKLSRIPDHRFDD